MFKTVEGEKSIMKYARKLRKGDKVAIVSLSSGMLGEDFCSHNIEIGVKRLKEYGLEPVFMPNARKGMEYLQAHPEARAKDLKDAFMDDSIAGIICAIGGDDTYRLLPYLMEDEEFKEAVEKHPKLFTGFSDTTVNHLMLYKLGLSTYYGPNFICDLGEIANEMLPYSKKAFEGYLEGMENSEIVSSEIWYEEREDFSRNAVGTERIAHKEERGFELLQGNEIFQGELLGGCLESLYDILTDTRYEDEKEVCERYGLFPEKEEWRGKILFIETCEEKPVPELFEKEITILKEKGVFDVINGVLVGKPQDEVYYEEYKEILRKVIENENLPVVYNVNFGHATPRCALQYGVVAKVDMKQKKIGMDQCHQQEKVRLTTQRLLLVPHGTKYLDTTHEYASDIENTKYMMALPSDSLEATRDFLLSCEKEWEKETPTFYEFAILREGVQIGSIGLYRNEQSDTVELGWILAKDYHKCGYATEAAKAVMEYAKEQIGITHFVAHCDSENTASENVMKKIGMTKVSCHGGRKNKNSDEERQEYMYEIRFGE